MKSSDIRKAFLDFFTNNDHKLVESSSLVPDDNSILFANSGMVQFKQVFLGSQKLSFDKATTCQKCVRAGGKHNDLDNVGFTSRHHTFFEMLGNFSFGSYDKAKAISLAWEFITTHLNLDKNKLYMTYHYDDLETRDIWKNLTGFGDDRLISMGDKSNFWAMGDTGPCGPCTEIFYDKGEGIFGDKPGTPDEDGDRFVEIWNIVFMQYERHPDGRQTKLAKLCVDTGMGLERIAAVMQGKVSNYDTDLFVEIKSYVASLMPKEHQSAKFSRENIMNIIADHIRCSVFLIADGVIPSNEKQGYVLRRIIRRALSFAFVYKIRLPFFAELAPIVIDKMKESYPYLVSKKDFISTTIFSEEEKFLSIINSNIIEVEELIAKAKKDNTKISGKVAFKLYDTYGFSLEILKDLAEFSGAEVDFAEFDKEMEIQRASSKVATSFTGQLSAVDISSYNLPKTDFVGYTDIECEAVVLAMLDEEGNKIEKLIAGQSGLIVLDKTPFYAESGGQISDEGVFLHGANDVIFIVKHIQKIKDIFIHQGSAQATISTGDRLLALVEKKKRLATTRTHTSAHLLHQTLINILGESVEQKGSRVGFDELRFDFNYPHKLSQHQLDMIETEVNFLISKALPTSIEEMSLTKAIEKGAKALFADKYGESVRVVSVAEHSIELCGGTHVKNTSEIFAFKIIKEEAIAAGTRRIEAKVALGAWEYINEALGLLDKEKKAQHTELEASKKENELLKKKILHLELSGLVGESYKSYTIYKKQFENADRKILKDTFEVFKSLSRPASVYIITNILDGNLAVGVGVSPELKGTIKANEITKQIIAKLGGKGGGKDEFAEVYLDKSALPQLESLLRELI